MLALIIFNVKFIIMMHIIVGKTSSFSQILKFAFYIFSATTSNKLLQHQDL